MAIARGAGLLRRHGAATCRAHRGATARAARPRRTRPSAGRWPSVQRDVDWQRARRAASRRSPRAPGPGTPGSGRRSRTATSASGRRYGKDACEAKQPGCERMDQVLFNAARAFQAARLLAKAIAVRKLLIDPRYNLDRTARRAEARARDRRGTTRRSPSTTRPPPGTSASPTTARRSTTAPDALEDAIVLRLGLGQEDQALHDADQFEKAYRARHAALAAQIAFAIGAHDVEHEDYDEGEAAPLGRDGRDRPERDRRRADPGARPARPRAVEDRRRGGRGGGVRQGARALPGPGGDRRQARPGRRRRRGADAAARQDAHRGGRGDLLLGGAEAEERRRHPLPRLQGLRPARRRARAHRHARSLDVDEEEAPRDRGGGEGVPQDPRPPARAAARAG